MAIVKTVSFYNFGRAFVEYGRNNNFSYEGKRILFDYLENLSEEIGEPIELDIIALCCEYSEMSLREACNDYGLEYDENDPDYTLNDLENHIPVLGSYECEETEQYYVVVQNC